MMLKDSVRLALLRPQTLLGLLVAETVFQRVANVGIVLTSANDSEHKGKGVAGEKDDPHFTGRAADLRIHHVDSKVRGTLVDALGQALGVEFTVLWESKGLPNEHLHLQYEGKP